MGRGVGVRDRQDHVRPDLELQVELAPSPAVAAPAIAAYVRGRVRSAPALDVTAIEDDFDVSIVPKPIDQILIETSIVARDEEQMPSHVALEQPSNVRFRACWTH